MISTEATLTLFDFRAPGTFEQWFTANDDAMGGVSESEITPFGDGFCRFSGNVSLECYGGYASIRTKPLEQSLEDFSGVIFLVRGDGKKYRFVTSDNFFEGISHQAEFRTDKGAWQEIRVPFENFRATLRGEDLLGVPPVSSGIIRQVGFLISDRQDGPFTLDIRWVRAFR